MIYLDNAATTAMEPGVVEAVRDSMVKDFANSGTVYKIGLDAGRRIDESRERIADCLRVPADYRVVFTSGGSESNNLFIKGNCFPDKKVACLGLEHPSVLETLDYFTTLGNESLRLKDCWAGDRFDIPLAVSHLREHRIRLLCLSHVNNETGAVHSPEEILAHLQRDAPQTRLFLDGVQAVGKLPVRLERWPGLAGYSISGHKIGGPKGIGALIYDSRLQLTPQIHGGKQQFGVRSGTLPTPLIVGLAHAVELAVRHQERNRAHVVDLRRRLTDGLLRLAERNAEVRIRFNSFLTDDVDRQSPHIVNFSFPPVEGEVLLHHLEREDIYVGMGSACSAHSKEPSKILTGIGLTEEEARCSLRISFGPQNNVEDVDRFLDAFLRAYQALYPVFSTRKPVSLR
jgi:cysteine desulfurase